MTPFIAPRAGDVLGGLQGQVLTQQLALLAGGREQPRRTARVAGPAAHEQPERRPRAIKAQPSGRRRQDQGQGRGAAAAAARSLLSFMRTAPRASAG